MIEKRLATEFSLRPAQVSATLQLIDEGNTIPFIARYRKEATGGLSDVVLRDLAERLAYLRHLEERKEEVLRLIEEQGKLTEPLESAIRAAEVLQRVEDLYKPFRQKKATRASKARDKGLEPLAVRLFSLDPKGGAPEEEARAFVCADPERLAAGKGAATVEEALAGASDIIAEWVADDPELVGLARRLTLAKGTLATEAADPAEATVYSMYYGSEEPLGKMPPHRILAVNRGESESKLKVRVKAPAEEIREQLLRNVAGDRTSRFRPLVEAAVEDGYKRLLAPALERELRSAMTERAEIEAVKVFAKNTEALLMAPPVKGARVLAIDPGFRTGCKVTAIDETGRLLAFTTIYPTEPRNDTEGAGRTLKKLIAEHDLNLIVIGNGTASRETEAFVAGLLPKLGREDLRYTIVSEAGASIYSASKVATEEHPDLDVTTRGALSIGRRLQDPLAELVKIPPRHIGVGQYQHDIDSGRLDGALTGVVENCVNRVGVDLNTASSSLLSYIAGVNGPIAKNIVAWREQNGRFQDRKELKKVPKLGEKTFRQCAGFLRIAQGKNPLDATAVHPESYPAALALLEKLGIDRSSIPGGAAAIEERIGALYGGIAPLAQELGVGVPTLADIISEMKKPARDPREGAPPVVFRSDILTIDDLEPGMELSGTVRNVVDFGAFVDIGVKQDGLVHISQISDRFVRHPMDVLAIGDTVKVRVLSVDKDRKKIALTMKRS